MNILYLHSHDSGRYISPYGYALPTPHLLDLAREGALFRRAFTVSPTCSPSRAALLTGAYPHQNGMLGLAHRGFGLRDCRQHLASFLKAEGFQTTLSGYQHEAADAGTLGYDEVLTEASESKDAEAIAARAEDYLARPRDNPFFLSVGFYETHRVFPEPDADIDALYMRAPEILPDTAENRADMAAYATSVRRFDRCVGRILRALDASPAGNDTLVICTTDHGLPFPGMKCNLTEHGTGVFLILRGPGGFMGGKVVDAMVTQLDLHPTICDLLGLEAPGHLEGCSLLPLVSGEDRLHDAVFGEVNFHTAYEPQRSVRTERYRYIRRYTPGEDLCLANIDACPSKLHLCLQGFAVRPVAREQLYDLAFDPLERNNLVSNPGYSDALAEMRERLDAWMTQTDDPLADGPIPPPPGASLARPSDWSAGQSEIPPEVAAVGLNGGSGSGMKS